MTWLFMLTILVPQSWRDLVVNVVTPSSCASLSNETTTKIVTAPELVFLKFVLNNLGHASFIILRKMKLAS
ncbi:hypothetical protein PM082_000371 [Marasmius tenuissimus]|nr:hypothetical protein PM082_000371 [Marasmius tenuissimus]